MKKKSKQSSPNINVGSTSIVMVFSVLCLTVFAVLSYITARNELDLARRSADSVTAYYAADSAAVDVYNALISGDCVRQGDTITAAGTEIFACEGIYGGELCYSVPIDDMQELYVELSGEDSGYRIIAWVVSDTGDWIVDDTLNLMQ